MDKQAIFGQNKILNHPEKIHEWLEGGDNTMITVELDLTNKCNNKCPKCIGWAGGKTQDELTTEEAKDYLKQIAMMGAKAVIFTGGGEPLLHKDATAILEYAKELGLHIGFITNGLALSKHSIVSILANCDWVRVSVDAGSPEMYLKTHGMDQISHGIVLGNIGKLVVYKKELKSKCVIGMGYLTGKDTIDDVELDKFAKMAFALGVDYAQFRPFHYDFTQIKDKVEALRKKYGDVITASWQKYDRFNDENKRPYDKCYGVNFATVIGANADMYVCCHMRGIEKYKLGNLRMNKLEDIWKRRQTIFDKIDFKDCPPLCRCDEFNRVLFEIIKPKQHPEFL